MGNIQPTALTAVVGSTSLSGALGAADWSDPTGSGLGWHGQIQVTLFNSTGAWSIVSGAHALGAASSGTYTGTLSGSYRVTVTAFVSPTVNFSYSGRESGTGSAVLGVGTTSVNVGANGVTITWPATGAVFSPGDAWVIKVGNLASTAMSLNDSAGTVVPATGTTSPAPTFQNLTATVTGSTPTAAGAAVNFLSAASTAGMGTYTVTPAVNISLDPGVWAQSYSATITYTILSTP